MNATVNHDTHVAHIEAVVARQRTFFETGATRPVAVRVAALRRLKKEMQKREKILLDALQADLNKSHFEGYMCELGLNLDELGYLADHVRAWSQPRRKPTPLPQFKSSSYELPEPYGVVLIMAPWNYPYLLSLDPLIGAVAAGNCVVLKPSAYAPNTSRAMAELLAAVFPPEWVTVIEGGREENAGPVGAALRLHLLHRQRGRGQAGHGQGRPPPDPRHPGAGRQKPRASWTRRPTSTWPPGGWPSASSSTAGQTCVAPDYCLVDRKVRDELVNELIQQFKKMLGEDPLANRNFVRIINHKHYNRLQGLLEHQDILYGGWHRDDPESDSGWIAPTLVADTLEGLSKPMGEEIFGPILPIIPYDDLDQALRFINRREKPLALYLFTRSKKTKAKVLNTCSFGGGCINDTIIHLATQPHGLRRRRQQRHGQLPRPPELRDLLPQPRHRGQGHLDRPPHALHAL